MFAERRDPDRIKRPTGERGKTREVDALGKTQAHEQELVGRFLAGERVVGDEAVPLRLDAREPSFRAFFGRGGAPGSVDVEPAMGAGPDAGIFAGAPVDEIVPAFAAGTRMVGNLVGRQAVRGANLERRVVEIARGIVVRSFQLAGGME